MTAPWGKRTDMTVHEAEPFNAEAPRAALRSARTPLDAFYVRSHGPVPLIAPDDWRLRVDGLVDRELTLSFDGLRERYAHREVVATLQCAGNRRSVLIALRDIPGHPWGSGATGTASWHGVALADVLAEAGVRDGARHVAFLGAELSHEPDPPERFGASIPLEKALRDEVLLAWEMNGEPLAPVHGAPVRAIVPGYIGARSVKWLQHVTVQEHPSTNFFQSVAYRLDGEALGAIPLNADIVSPIDGATVPAGELRVSGYALAGDGCEVASVEVSADGGATWRPAALSAEGGRWAWRRWEAAVEIAPGSAEIVARARDERGATHAADATEVWNVAGYANTAWPRVRVTATAPG